MCPRVKLFKHDLFFVYLYVFNLIKYPVIILNGYKFNLSHVSILISFVYLRNKLPLIINNNQCQFNINLINKLMLVLYIYEKNIKYIKNNDY